VLHGLCDSCAGTPHGRPQERHDPNYDSIYGKEN
jgi:hypothetical protein